MIFKQFLLKRMKSKHFPNSNSVKTTTLNFKSQNIQKNDNFHEIVN